VYNTLCEKQIIKESDREKRERKKRKRKRTMAYMAFFFTANSEYERAPKKTKISLAIF
jgi:hypothetical protein